MSLYSRLSNGWSLSMASFEVIKKNKQLLLFPLFSTLSLILTLASFLGIIFSAFGFDLVEDLLKDRSIAHYALVFGFYLFNYFIIVFFNMGLIHCTRLYFHGEEPTVRKGLEFSFSRIGKIFAWAVFAATVGLLLNVLENNLGKLGKIVIGLIGVIWSVATFFVVPVLAYEDVGPVDAFKRSALLMKQKWGESLGANFSFGIIQLIVLAVVILPAVLFTVWGYGLAVFIVGFIIFFSLSLVVSAAKMIFITAVYEHVNNNFAVEGFNANTLDGMFVQKEKKGLF